MTLGRPSHDTTCCCGPGVGLFLLGNHVSGHEIRDRDHAPLHYAGTQVHHGGSDHVRSGMDTPQTPDNLGQWRVMAIVGALMLLGGTGGVAWSEQVVPSNIAAIILGWLLAGERPNSGSLAATAVILLGVLMIVRGTVRPAIRSS